MLRSDYRTIQALVAPYGRVATVVDGSCAYREMFVHGAFREQIEEARSRPLRIWLHLEHRKEAVIGHAVQLVERDGGLYGAFAIRTGVAGDKVLAAIREGVLTGVSMQATPLRSGWVNGVTQRLKAHLMAVALVPEPAYPNAKVLGIRKAWRGEQEGPASTDEFNRWELERLDGKLRAVARQRIDEAPRDYTRDPRYQRVLRLREEIAEERAEIERHLRPQPDPQTAAEAEALRPKVVRRVLSGPITIC
jgi:HK97 family phage prohead protease